MIPLKPRSRSTAISFVSLLAAMVVTAGCASASGTSVPTPAEPVASDVAPPAVVQPQVAPAVAQQEVSAFDTIEAGAFDNGRMWTFEYPPARYFADTYGFSPDEEWFSRARLAALRIPSCSASFVSPNGLVMTNHHCARDHVSAVSREGETLLDDGFYAATLADERPVEDFTADQLVEIRDISDEVLEAQEGIAEDQARADAREGVLESIEARILEEMGGEDAGYHIELISLYNGGRHSAYIFRRYTDVRLVMAPELKLGYFGGDPDNFTYPRYSLDMSFFRVYGEDGDPLDTSDHYFPWSTEGVERGDAVFVIGNPGSTSRIQTVAELEFRRDVSDKGILDFINSRIEALQEFYDADPATGESLDLRNEIFGLLNSQKAYTGIIGGLHDPVILAKRRDYERDFVNAIESDPDLQAEFGGLVARMAKVQDQKREIAPGFGAFLGFQSAALGSATLARVLPAFQYLSAQSGGAPAEMLEEMKDEFLAVPDQPEMLEELLIEARLHDLIRSYGEDDPTVQTLLGGRTPEGAAAVLVANSVLSDSATAAAALENGTLLPTDPAMGMLQQMFGVLGPFQQRISGISTEEGEIALKLGRARFAVYGTTVPPDATFSLRIADGVVDGYEYNGTVAPILTTYYGMYDRYHSNGGSDEQDSDWDLPSRWLNPPPAFDMSTPINFVSTADIIGGNSGSPLVNRDLEVVGLAFDGNIESLPGDYIFLTERARTVSVDVRGILEALDDIYEADRIVEELRAGATAGSR